MKKILKVILLLSVLVFVTNCQKVKATNSAFEVVDENIDLTPDIKPPVDTDDEIQNGNKPSKPVIPGEPSQPVPPKPEPLAKLTEQEFSIIEPESFTMKLPKPFVPVARLLEFRLSQGNPKIDMNTLRDKSQTCIIIKVTLVERAGGVLEYMRKGISVDDLGNNNYNIVCNHNLKKALPELGTYAKYKVDVYIKDKRESIKYLVTHRSFIFTVYGDNF